jgi:hypothetical protein
MRQVDQPVMEPFHGGANGSIKPRTAEVTTAHHMGSAEKRKSRIAQDRLWRLPLSPEFIKRPLKAEPS